MKEKNNSYFFTKLKHKYRLIIMSEKTLEEKMSFRLSQLNVLSFAIVIVVVLFLCFLLLVGYTPLNEYMPGKASNSLYKELIALALKTDSLEKTLQGNELYLKNINAIVRGEDPVEMLSNNNVQTISESDISFKKSIEDSLLRISVESEDKSSLSISENSKSIGLSNVLFFNPVKGIVINSFNPQEAHFGTDIIANEEEPIKSVLDGVVVMSDWTSETGYVIGIQHANGLFSFYKHNSILFKKPGEYVKSGEVIAVIGNSGELSSGTHLHFELWDDGRPLNPEDYINF